MFRVQMNSALPNSCVYPVYARCPVTLAQIARVPAGPREEHAECVGVLLGTRVHPVEHDPRVCRVAPRHEHAAIGGAEGGRGEPLLEGHALGSQAVEVGRLDVSMPHEAVIGVTLIVREDQDDVGWFRISARCQH